MPEPTSTHKELQRVPQPAQRPVLLSLYPPNSLLGSGLLLQAGEQVLGQDSTQAHLSKSCVLNRWP